MNPTDIFHAYFSLGQNYAALVHPYALDLFAITVLLEIGTISITYMLGAADEPAAVGWSIVRLLFCSGFSYWWLIQSWTMAVYVVGSFDEIGQALTGLPNLQPMTFLQTALQLAKVIWAAPASSRLIPDVGLAMEASGLCFAIFIVFVLIAALVVFTMAMFYLITGPGSILVSFMPCRFTAAMSENYFTWLVRTGVTVMMFYVVLGTAQTFANTYNTTLTAMCNPTLAVDPLAALGAAPISVTTVACTNPIPIDVLLQILEDMVLLAAICVGIPFAAAALVSHGVNMTLEHMASAKYLAGGTVRTLAHAVERLAHQVSRMSQYQNTQSTLNERMAAGAAAVAATASPTAPFTPPSSPPPSSGGWNGSPSGPPIAPPPNNGSGSGGAALEYYPGRPGAQTRAEAIDITKLQKK